MSRRFAGFVLLIATSSTLMGCTSSGLFGMKSKSVRDQWEPDIEEAETKPADWRSAPSNMRKGRDKVSKEDGLDKYIWSDEARDINRSLGGSL